MVTQTNEGMSACADFKQNAWKPDLCANCQRPRGEHGGPNPENVENLEIHQIQEKMSANSRKDSPKPAKRNSLMTKSITVLQDGQSEDEEEKWNAMCLPDPDQPNRDLDSERIPGMRMLYTERVYEEIGEGSSSQSDLNAGLKPDSASDESSKTTRTSDGTRKHNGNMCIDKSDVNKSKSSTDNGSPKAKRSAVNIAEGQRSRSSSRDKSPVPGPKPKLSEKPLTQSSNKSVIKKVSNANIPITSATTRKLTSELSRDNKSDFESDNGSSSAISRKMKKSLSKVSFTESDPVVIGNDGGYDNLFLDQDDDVSETDDEVKEILKFSENEKEWALLALKNTIINSDIGASNDGAINKLRSSQSKEFEDVELEYLWKPDRFAQVRDCPAFPTQQVYGTFPLRTKPGKSGVESYFDGSHLSCFSESTESTVLEPIEELNEKYEAFIRLGNKELKSKTTKSEKDARNASKHEINCSEDSDPNYDDPWEGKFGFDADSEMNLLDEIRGEIDLDSSSAGMALVDMLNDVLAKYSTGTPSETDSVLNFDFLEDEKFEKIADMENKHDKKDRKDKKTELEAKMVTLAASLRKKQAKGKAPHPPSCPPEPPMQSPSVSPAKTAEMRAAQSKEPTFKMVPLGKAIGSSATLPQSQSDTAKSLEQNSEQESMEGYKIKLEKKEQKKAGGISSFFSRFLRRGRESESDLTVSSETLVSNSGSQSEHQSDSDSLSDKGSYSDRKRKDSKGDNSNKRTSKSSPQMKLKVLPTKPLSPKPEEKHSQNAPTKNKNDESKGSPKPSRSKANKGSPDKLNDNKETNDSKPDSKKSSPKTSKSKEDLVQSKNDKSETSPTKSADKVVLKHRPQSPSPKSKEAPPLPPTGPREHTDSAGVAPKPRARGSSEGGARSRPRTRDFTDKQREILTFPPPKPPVAAKPKNPVTQAKSVDSTDGSHSSPTRERLASSSSLDEDHQTSTRGSRDSQKRIDPKLLRKRAKSPKRFAAPIPPCRASLPNLLSESASASSLTSTASEASVGLSHSSVKTEPMGLAFAKELEIKLSKDLNREPTEPRKMAAAPPPPPSPTPKVDTSEKSKTLPQMKSSKTNKETLKTATSDSKLSQKDVPKSNSKEDTKLSPPQDEVKRKSPTAEVENQDTSVRPIEKIELPRSAGNSRKSFLGKLNRKNRPPPPPSVKRTKSISEASRDGEQLHLKKIDLKDISGPVLITDMVTNKIVRRNTITIGDDNAFLSGGSTSSGSASIGEKSDVSPRGSLENLYELITPESPAPLPGVVATEKRNFYDPVDEEGKVTLLRPPSMTGSEGYLEPIKTNGGAMLDLVSHVVEPPASLAMGMVSMATSVAGTATSASQSMESVNVLNDDIDVTPITEIDPVEDFNLSDERRQLIAAQPIYEEINGYGKLDSSNNAKLKAINQGVNTSANNQQSTNIDNTTVDNEGQFPLPTSSLKSKDSFSSESDLSSANSSLSRGPRPLPRRRPRQSFGSTIEQYVAMNRPSAAVFLNEDQLREMMKVLTAMTLHTLRDVYTQHEKCFTKESVHIGATGPLKWHDFDIYGKPIHTSERCIAYNAKLKPGLNPCQVMLLHSRPEITPANHPSLMKPTCIFTDSIPVSYLTKDFINTSQLLHTFVDQSNSAKCYIAVGLFDIAESLTTHLNSLESACTNQKDFLSKGLFFLLQLLSAISHCIEQGHPLAEADFRDVYLITNPYYLGETVSFLPQLRSPENQQINSVCLFLERFLEDICVKCDATSVLDDSAFFTYSGVQRIMTLLQAGTVECLPIVRSYTEYILWGPDEGDLYFADDRTSNVEPKLSMWLEKQRAELIHNFATRVQHGARYQITDFYRLKFLLKASSGTLSESIRCHASS